MRLKDRVALITGAGRGIGRIIALAYAKEGAGLALAARTTSELQETAQKAEALGAEALVVTTDVSDETQVNNMVRQTLDKFSMIDVLVNNAGFLGPVGPVHETDVASWVRAVHVNIIGPYLCCRAVLPVMLRQNRGKIINNSGAFRAPWPYLSAHAVSRQSAVIRLAETPGRGAGRHEYPGQYNRSGST